MNSKQLIKIAKQLYAAITQLTNDEEYQQVFRNYYHQNGIGTQEEIQNFINITLQSDINAQRMFKRMFPQATVHTLTNGNVYMKYMQMDDRIILLALLSKNGKLKPSDGKDVIQQMNLLLQKLKVGKFIQTSCNSNSLPLLKQLQKLQRKNSGKPIKIEKISPDYEVSGQGTWANYRAYI